MMLMTAAVLSGPCLLVPLGHELVRSLDVLAAAGLGSSAKTSVPPGQNAFGAGLEDAETCRARFWLRPRDGTPRERLPAARRPWLVGGAAAALLAAVLPAGVPAGIAAAGWLAVTVSLWIGDARRWWDRRRALGELPPLVAWAWLPVAAGWFVASRAGVAPLGFGEPITLLTAAHFHVAGFGLSVLAIATACRLGRSRMGVLAWAAWALVTAGPICVAAGFTVDEPVLNMVGAFVVATGVFALGPCLVVATHGAARAARWSGRVAAVVPLVPMVLAVVYSLGPVLGTPAPSIELMVRAHGIVNALGFVGLGLAAFVLIERGERRNSTDLEEVDGVVAA